MKSQNLALIYDGSFAGMLSCVFSCFQTGFVPLEVRTDNCTLLPTRVINTNHDHADRVIEGVGRRLGATGQAIVADTYLLDHQHKELLLIQFLECAMSRGTRSLAEVHFPSIGRLDKQIKLLHRESMRYIQFVRFEMTGNVLAAIIEPQNYVLPRLADHFAARLPRENFLIYDQTHQQVLIHDIDNIDILPLLAFRLPTPSEQEARYQQLWRSFYDAVEIKSRHSDARRSQLMPKKYWKYMTEMQ